MTIQEMHIGIDLYLQKVNSSYVDSLQPEEKDWFINAEQKRFIFNRINAYSNDKKQGNQSNQKRYDDLQKLITPFSAYAYVKETESKFITLPSDYLYLLNDRSEVDVNCATYVESNDEEDIFFVSFSIAEVPDDKLAAFEIILNGNPIFSTADYPNLVINSPEESFTLIDLIIYSLKLNNIVCYWENFGTIYRPNQFIAIVDDSETITVRTIDLDYSEEFDFDHIVNDIMVYSPTKKVPNRLTKTEDVFEVIRGAFTRPTKDSPVSVLENDQLIVYHNASFILTKIFIQYFRQPRSVSLSLGINSELSPSVHEELVTQVSKRLAAYIETRNYPQISNENIIKE